MHLQATVRPVGEALAEAEGRRMHRDRLFREHIGNNRLWQLRHSSRLPSTVRVATFTGMYVVTEADAAAIREVYERDGELSAAIELRRRFPGITDNAKAREQARAIAGWQPLPEPSTAGSQALPEGRRQMPLQGSFNDAARA